MARDAELTRTVAELWGRYEELAGSEAVADQAAVEELRWMIEELRVSLFAQPLGTSINVSPQRIEKQVQKIAQAAHG